MEAVERLSTAFATVHPQDTARVLERLPLSGIADFMSRSSTAVAAGVLQCMTPALCAACLGAMNPGLAGQLLDALPPDFAVLILRVTESDTQARLFDVMGPDSAEPFRRRLRYPENTAGSLMDPRVLTLPDDIDVSEALDRIKRAAQPVEFYVYVVDRSNRLTGVVTLRELIRASGDELLQTTMQHIVARLAPTASQGDLALNPYWREFRALPVVSGDGSFLGIVRYKTARSIFDQMTRTQAGNPAMETMVSLGEMYWTALSGFLTGMGQGPVPGDSRGDAKDGQ